MPTTEQLNSALDGRYAIDRLIGEGGMATVYLARDVRHNRKVALKVLRPSMAAPSRCGRPTARRCSTVPGRA